MIIGEQLQQCRQQQNLTQAAVAVKLNVSRQTISNWENSRSYLDIERSIHLADWFVCRYQLKLRLTASFIVTVGLFSVLVIYLLLWLIA